MGSRSGMPLPHACREPSDLVHALTALHDAVQSSDTHIGEVAKRLPGVPHGSPGGACAPQEPLERGKDAHGTGGSVGPTGGPAAEGDPGGTTRQDGSRDLSVRDPDDPVHGLRRPVYESWRRSRDAGIAVAIPAAPQVYEPGDLAEARAAHPLDPHLPMLRGLLRSYTDETEHLMVVTDADGHALWCEGTPAVLRQASRIGLLEGFCWSERSIGTNGIGTALATGAPQYVYSAEHLVSSLHGWSCAGAPIVDPDTGRVIGCVDVSGTVKALHPAAVALVGAAAALAEAQLELQMRRGDESLRERYRRHLDGLRGEPGALVTPTGRILLAEPAEWRGRRIQVPAPGGALAFPDGSQAAAEPVGEVFLLRATSAVRRPSSPRPRPGSAETPLARGRTSGPIGGAAADTPLLALALLGDDPPSAWIDGRRLRLSLRHAEILALLALYPRGLTADRLSLHLYGEASNPVTVRAEIHRLRAQLGDVVRAKPYRLDCAVDGDLLAVRRLLDAGEVAAAIRLWRGDLLPQSDVPAIRAERDELTMLLRRSLLDHGDIDLLWTYTRTETGRNDLEVLEHLSALLPPGDPRHDAVAARGRRILTEDD
ncbi:GAF domain-containing protein [Actinomadura sp. 9N407]|uniref:GAF domain-containing protein n=1 Tax=Actinomadura sp. 9N407 TaxID=3375154 RepID=UPI0037AA0FCB